VNKSIFIFLFLVSCLEQEPESSTCGSPLHAEEDTQSDIVVQNKKLMQDKNRIKSYCEALLQADD